jgi:hypothetical protein
MVMQSNELIELIEFIELIDLIEFIELMAQGSRLQALCASPHAPGSLPIESSIDFHFSKAPTFSPSQLLTFFLFHFRLPTSDLQSFSPSHLLNFFSSFLLFFPTSAFRLPTSSPSHF